MRPGNSFAVHGEGLWASLPKTRRMPRGVYLRRQYLCPLRQPDGGCPVATSVESLRRHLRDEHGVLSRGDQVPYVLAARRRTGAWRYL